MYECNYIMLVSDKEFFIMVIQDLEEEKVAIN